MLNLLKKKQNIIENVSTKDAYIINKSIKPVRKVILTSPSTKEWTNSIYSYNKDYTKLLVYKDKLVNYLFKSYFNLTRKLLQVKRSRFNPYRFSSNRIFLSKAEIKHTNNNINITLYILNKNKNFMKNKLNKLRISFYKLKKLKWNNKRRRFTNVFRFNAINFKKDLYRIIKILVQLIRKNINTKLNILFNLSENSKLNIYTNHKLVNLIKKNTIVNNKISNIYLKRKYKLIKRYIGKVIKSNNTDIRENLIVLLNGVYNTLSVEKLNNSSTNNLTMINSKLLKKNSTNISNNNTLSSKKNKENNIITLLNYKNFRIYKFLYYYQMLIFNKNKFTNWFLNYRGFGLINIISKIYNKKVEFNIVNLKTMHLNSDIYTEAIALKLRNRRNKLLRLLKKALFKIKVPRLHNYYSNDHLAIPTNKGLVLKSLNYKLISGVRFEASGRLSRRLIASRSVFKFRYVGNLKNIYSSFLGLPSVMLRGYVKPNLQYTMINSKTRNGAFGLKGWTSSF